MSIRYEATVLDLVNSVERSNRSLPLLLGGVPSSGGGEGGPPGGFIGYLPQNRVTYDYLELSATGILSSGGPSLYDNLNHIRRRLTVLEASGVGGSNTLSIYDEGTVVATGVLIIDFIGNLVTATKPSQGRVSVTISGSTDTYKDMVSSLDTTPDYLKNKIRQGSNITITLVSGGANEFLQVASTASGGSSTSKVKASTTDTTEDYLNIKLRAGSNITLVLISGGANEYIRVDAATSGGSSTSKVKISTTDTTEDYLRTKLRDSSQITFTQVSGGANEFLQGYVSATVDTKKVLATATDTTEDYIRNKIRQGTNVTITLVSGGANEFLQVSASGGGGSDSKKVLVSATDTTEDYLNLKLRSSPNIVFTVISGGANEFIQASGIGIGSTDTKKVLATVTDTTEDYIRNKIRQGSNVTITLVSGGANEFLKVDATISGGSSTSKVKASPTDTTEDYLNLKIRSGPNVTLTLVSGGSYEFLQASGTTPLLRIDQSGGTGDTYGVLSGALNGVNKVYVVSMGSYVSASLAVYLNGQLQTQGTGQDWVEAGPTSGYFVMNIPPASTDQLTAVYGVIAAGLIGPQGPPGSGGGGAPGFQTLTPVGSGIGWNLSLGSATVTVSGLMNMANPTNLGLGAHYFLSVKQLSTSGNNTLDWNNAYKFPNNEEPTLSTYKGREDIIPFECDGTYMYALPIVNNVTNQPVTLGYLTNLLLWFKADGSAYSDAGGTTPCADGDAVYVWKDTSGNSYNATQSTLGYRPLYKTKIINGKPVIRFDGTDDVLAITSSLASAGDNLSFFMVVKPSNTTPIGIFDSGDEDSIRNYSTGQWDWFSGSPYVSMSLADANPVILEFIHTLPTYRNVDYYKNGVLISNNSTADSSTTNWGSLAGLGSINFGYAFYTGDIAEFLLYKEAVSTAHRQDIELYLKMKYGIT